jgi:hypothetical protein
MLFIRNELKNILQIQGLAVLGLKNELGYEGQKHKNELNPERQKRNSNPGIWPETGPPIPLLLKEGSGVVDLHAAVGPTTPSPLLRQGGEFSTLDSSTLDFSTPVMQRKRAANTEKEPTCVAWRLKPAGDIR